MIASILLVEDNPNDVELTIQGLRAVNLANDIFVVHDGDEALQYLYRRGKYSDRSEANPAVILLDLKLPKVSGLDVLKSIKSDSNLRKIPTVMLTSSSQESDLMESYENGVNAYVVKPIDFQNFNEAIKHLGVFWALINEAPSGSIRQTRDF
jgi:CheY-like chemotaxis protein